jgi:hypothetical protein
LRTGGNRPWVCTRARRPSCSSVTRGSPRHRGLGVVAGEHAEVSWSHPHP